MSTHALILLAGAAILGAITIAIDAILMRRRRSRRTACLIRHLEDRVSTLEADLAHAEADRDHISEELDEAYAGILMLTVERDRLRARAAPTWDRVGAEALIAMIEDDLNDKTGDPTDTPEAQSGWDRALKEYGAPAIEALRGAMAEIDRLRWLDERRAGSEAILDAELQVVISERDAIAIRCADLEQQYATLERIGGRAIDRSARHRLAIGRLKRCVRRLLEDVRGLTLHGRMQVAVSQNPHCTDLVPFVDGELTEDRAAAFRAHLPGCERCQAETTEAVQVSARLSEAR